MGNFRQRRDGYIIIDGSEEDLYVIMLKYFPVVAHTVSPVLNVDQQMEAAKKAAAAMQGK